ncbi:MarR family winged helix-turn-helix transcriptional regulator [Psychroflexus planctonicus]|uniref:MarR family transcriptional regulator n=1 Tax=Psychroflexus planctonicus TaxID=1526575 RepID=A0ABQ1SLI9_9FLAO|nr:MarR family transcriptional regulator [Psychroflexus planctonicus]GGE42366.1 MarR family transcriptional regulator [Psychroflexus planctonicus]
MKIEEQIQTKKKLPLYKRALINTIYTSNWITDEMNSVLKPFDISTQQFNVLRILKGREGKATNLSTIQERMIAKNSNTTRLVDKLIKKGLVEKQICETNKRKVEIYITQNGISFLDKVNLSVEDREIEITQSMNKEELENLSNLLTQLRA